MKKNILIFLIAFVSFGFYACKEKDEPTPSFKTMTITDIRTTFNQNVGFYVILENVQFVSTDTARLFNGTTFTGNRTLQDCQGNTITVTTDPTSNYTTAKVPDGRGTFKGIISGTSSNPSLVIISDGDFASMTQDRCIVTPPPISIAGTRTNIADVRALFTSGTFTISTAIKIRGVVTSISGTGTNFNAQNLTMQDGSAGITVRFAAAHPYTEGDEIEIGLQTQDLSLFSGLLQATKGTVGIALTNSTKVGTAPLSFRTATIPEINSGLYESQLVMVTGARFPTANGTLTYTSSSGNVLISDGTNTTTFRSASAVSWATTVLPTGTNLSPKGIASVFNTTRQILPRKASDLQ